MTESHRPSEDSAAQQDHPTQQGHPIQQNHPAPSDRPVQDEPRDGIHATAPLHPLPPRPETAPSTPYALTTEPAMPFGAPGTATAPTGARTASRRGVGTGTLIAAVLAAGLVGGGVGAGVGVGVAAQNGTSTEQGQGSAGASAPAGSGLEVNRQEDATAVTAAAAKASPSVATISAVTQDGAGSGSGVVIDDQGHILTNTHVVTLGGQSADARLTVQASDGRIFDAQVVGTDPESDLAVIKVDGADLPAIELGDSGALNVGDRTIAIGAPLGLSGTVTDGIVSTLDRTISVASSAVPDQEEQDSSDSGEFEFRVPGQAQSSSQESIYINVIQTDAAINPGNSGGALLDEQGRLIGINVAIASSASSSGEAGNIGVGFAIPVDHAHRVAQELIEHGEATHGMLGVQVTAQPATPEGDTENGQDSSSPSASTEEESQDPYTGASASGGFSAGALVREVVADSPAAQAGLQEGDIITGVEDRPVRDSRSLTAIVREYPEGGTATVHYLRDGQQQSTTVTFASDAAQ